MTIYTRLFLGFLAGGFGVAWLQAIIFGSSAIHQILAAVYALSMIACVAALGLNTALMALADRLPKPRQSLPSERKEPVVQTR